MRPKKTKELIPQIAKELQLSEEQVKSVMDIYWDQVRKTLSSLEYNRLFLRGLGVFYIKPWALEKKLKSNSSRVSEYMDNPSNYGLQKMNDIMKFINENFNFQISSPPSSCSCTRNSWLSLDG